MRNMHRKLFLFLNIIFLLSWVWSCAPGGSSDTESPTVVGVLPDNGSLAVDVTTNPKVTFSEAISSSSVIPTENGSCVGSVQLSSSGSTECVIADLSLSTNGEILTISPTENLSFSTGYTLKLTTELTDLAGNPLASEYLSTFTTADDVAGLADTVGARLRSNLQTTLSSTQIDTILASAEAQLAAGELIESEDPTLVLPSFLTGSMTGIGQANSGDDTLEAISITTATITALIGEFEDKLVSTARLNRGADAQAAFENLLGLLIEAAVAGLAETGLSDDALDDGFGEVVGAVISSLDEANTEATEISAAVQVVTKKAVQKAGSVSGMDPAAAIQSATKNAVKGLGQTNLSAAEVTATLSTTVKTVVDSLDEVEGGTAIDLSTVVAQVATSSIEGLAELQQTFVNDAEFDLSAATNGIASGATEGAGELAAANATLDLGTTIGALSKSTAAALGKLTTDAAVLETLSKGVQGQIESEIDAINTTHPNWASTPKRSRKRQQTDSRKVSLKVVWRA